MDPVLLIYSGNDYRFSRTLTLVECHVVSILVASRVGSEYPFCKKVSCNVSLINIIFCHSGHFRSVLFFLLTFIIRMDLIFQDVPII